MSCHHAFIIEADKEFHSNEKDLDILEDAVEVLEGLSAGVEDVGLDHFILTDIVECCRTSI